jgi:hypothetical protein
VLRALALVAYFLIIFGWVGTLIRADDVATYNLQQLQIYSLAENGSIALTPGPHPLLAPKGDVFIYEGRNYAAKQPGLAFWAWPWVHFLGLFGLSYESAPMAMALTVTWFAGGSFIALVLVIWTAVLWPKSQMEPRRRKVLALALPIGWVSLTPILPYLGLLHHDIFSAGLLVLAGLAVFAFSSTRGEFLAWALAGLSLFFSGLPTLAIGAAAATRLLILSRSWRWLRVVGLLGGLLLGALPTLITQYLLFGHPLNPGHWAGGFDDTTLSLKQAVWMQNLWTYFGGGIISVWLYAPLFVPGLILVWRIQRWRWLLPAVAAHIAGVLSLETIGHCQWGPRYLMPLHALSVMGVVTWFLTSRLISWRRRTLSAGLLVLVAISAALQWIGTRTGTMLCDFRVDPPLAYIRGTIPAQPHVFPLEIWGLGVSLLGLILIGVLATRLDRKRVKPPGADSTASDVEAP